MKKIIDGKKYDTETATLLAEDRRSSGDSDWYREALYCAKNGSFFLAGEGGATSSWGREIPHHGRDSGSGIRALSAAETRTWVEKHANDHYEEIFGIAPEA